MERQKIVQGRPHREENDLLAKRLGQIRAGDARALGELLASLRAYLLAAAHRELDSELLVKVGPSDVVQETFLQAQQHFAAFKGTTDAELRNWLQRILQNRCRDLRDAFCGTAKRQLSREVRLEALDSNVDGPLAALEDGHSTPSEHLAGEEEGTRLMAALNLLPEEHRQVVWLRNWEGLSFNEIGRQTGRTADASRKMFFRAVQKLSRLLE
jgi:RNA polymerase sigma-70 factor, ECF subfamily